MAFLATQIAVYLTLAALLGAGVGWLVRGAGRRPAAPDPDLVAAREHIERLERRIAVYEAARPVTADAEAP